MEMPATVKVFLKSGKELKPEKDGFIGTFSYSEHLENLILEVAPESEGLFVPLRVKMKPISPQGLEKEIILEPIKTKNENGKTTYEKEVAIHIAKSGLLTTKWPKNHIKLVHMIRENSKLIFYLWEAGIVTQQTNQAANFFFTVQCVHKSKMFKNRFGKVVLPDWPESVKWLTLWNNIEFLVDSEQLPLLHEKPAETKGEKVKDKKGGKRDKGTVLWYNLAYQIGAVKMGDQNRRVHWSEIESPSRFKFLKKGQMVRVRRIGTAKNIYPYSPRLTSFKEDALRVTPL